MQNENKLEKLKSILELMQNDTITPAKLAQFITAIVKVVKDSKESMESTSQDVKDTLNNALEYLEKEHNKILEKVSSDTSSLDIKLTKKLEKSISDMRSMCDEMMMSKPKDGKDADEELIVEKVLARIPEHEEVELDEAEDIVEKLESLEGEDRLDAKAIKNLPNMVKGMVVTSQHYLPGTGIAIEGNVISTTGSGTGIVETVVAGTGISVDSTDPANPVVTNTAPDQVISLTAGTNIDSITGTYPSFTINASTQSGTTDEKVKYDAGDPTAGYVADKIVAGTGISVSEGTGATENKLVITNTDKGSDVDLSGYALTGDIPADISELTDTTGIIPTSTSDLTNDSGFITAGDIPSIPVNSDFNLGGLGDVNDTGKATGKVLKYNSVSGDWEIGDDNNTTYTSTDFDIKDLTDSTNLRTTWSGKQDALTFGIANTNAVKIDHASVADNDYAKFTANGLEGMSYSEVLSDIGAEPADATILKDADIGSTIQAYDAGLTDIAGLAVTDGNIIVGNGTNWVAESGSTARSSLGLGSLATLSAVDADSVTVSNLEVDNLKAGVLDTDLSSVSASDDTIPSAKATKTALDAKMTNPMTTQGDVIYGGASGTPTRLAKGTAGQVLTMNAGATAPEWSPGGGTPPTYYNGVLLTGAKFPRVHVGNAASGQVDVYTVPANKRAFLTTRSTYNPTDGTITAIPQIKISGTYYALDAATSTNATAGVSFAGIPSICLNAGESFSIFTSGAGLNYWTRAIEFDDTSGIKDSRLVSLSTGNNTVYTVPAGKTALLLSGDFSLNSGVSTFFYRNNSGGSRTVSWYVVPSGDSPSTANQIIAAASVSNSASRVINNNITLNAGDSVVINTSDGTGEQIAIVHVMEI